MPDANENPGGEPPAGQNITDPGQNLPPAEPPAEPPAQPPAEPPAEPPKTITTDQFGDFRDQMHKDIRGDDAFKDMKGVNDLAHAYLDRLDGYVRKPGGEATDEEVNQFYRDMGVPDTEEPYVQAFQEVEIPENIEADEDFVNEAIAKARELNMFPFQLQEMLNWYYGRLDKVRGEFETEQLRASEDAMQQLRRDWGVNFRANSAVVERAITALGGEDLLAWADEKGISNDTTFMRMMYAIGRNLTEDMVLQGVPTRQGGVSQKQTHLQYANTPEKGKM